MKVVGIGEEKGRCYEYFPFMVCPFSEADEIMRSREFDFLQMDEMYVVDQLEDLEETAKKGFIAESKKYEFNFSGMSSSEMRSIINQLNNMRQEISNRVTPLE